MVATVVAVVATAVVAVAEVVVDTAVVAVRSESLTSHLTRRSSSLRLLFLHYRRRWWRLGRKLRRRWWRHLVKAVRHRVPSSPMVSPSVCSSLAVDRFASRPCHCTPTHAPALAPRPRPVLSCLFSLFRLSPSSIIMAIVPVHVHVPVQPSW